MGLPLALGGSGLPVGATSPSPYATPRMSGGMETPPLVAGAIVDGFKVTPALIAKLQMQAQLTPQSRRASETQPPVPNMG